MKTSLPNAGTIEILYYGVWGSIYGDNIDILAGHVVCRQLGYNGAEQVFHRAAFGPVKGPMWIWDIQCYGNETKISQCQVKTFEDVIHMSSLYSFGFPGHSAGVICRGMNSSASAGWLFLVLTKSN